jgi:hypothetical protein
MYIMHIITRLRLAYQCIHCGVEVTESSTNKQISVSRSRRHETHSSCAKASEADRIVESTRSRSGGHQLNLTARPEQVHQALITRNAHPEFMQYASKKCDVDGDYYSKLYEIQGAEDIDSDKERWTTTSEQRGASRPFFATVWILLNANNF